MTASSPQTGLTLSPISFFANVTPGGEFATKFSLTNNTDSTLTINIVPAEGTKNANGEYVILEDPAKFLSAQWVKVSDKALTVAAGRSETLSISGSVPASAQLGSYFPMLLVKFGGGNDQTGSTTLSTDIAPNIGFSMLLNVTNQEPKTSVEVTKLISAPITLGENIQIDYQITNLLPLYIKPIAYLQVVSPRGEIVFKETINDQLQILNGYENLSEIITTRIASGSISDTGNYRAELLAVDTQFGTSDLKVTNILYIPAWLVIVLGVVLIVLFLILLRRVFAYRRHKVESVTKE